MSRSLTCDYCGEFLCSDYADYDEAFSQHAPDCMRKLIEERDRFRSDCLEQARLLGMSGEREADLRGRLERAEREADRLRAELFMAKTQLDGWIALLKIEKKDQSPENNNE